MIRTGAWVVLWRVATTLTLHPDRQRPATRSEALRLLDALRHLGHAHQWPGELVEELIGVLLFAQGELQQLHDRRHLELLCEVSRRDIARHLFRAASRVRRRRSRASTK